MSKRKGEELAGPSRKKHAGQVGTSQAGTSQAGTSSRVSDDEEEEMDLTQRADFDVNTVSL
jgi:hypothetical protein